MISAVIVLLLSAHSSLYSSADENVTKCTNDQKKINEIIHRGKAVDVFYFVNDTKETIQLTWAGENSGVLILVTMTEGEAGPGLTSDIYRSENNGKTFVKITHQLGEKVYIRRENGLQRHQNQRDSKELFVICYDIDNKDHSVLFVTQDGGSTWERSAVPFLLSGQLRFYPRKRLSPWILTLEDKTSRLYLSLNNGKTWTLVHENVVDYFWSIYQHDPLETFYVLHRPPQSNNDTTNQILSKTTNFGESWTHVLEKVVRVWAPRGIRTQTVKERQESSVKDIRNDDDSDELSRNSGVFLYVAHHTGSENQSTRLSVSKDGGMSFQPVYLPPVQSERFFSVLEVEDDMAFLHVDAPNDTGYGTLYISDSTGQIFSESLRQHLYPNHAPITDFYRVASMRGTYLATRLNPDRTLHTVITHDRGASWRALGAPLNVDGACKNDAINKGDEQTSTPMSTATFSKQTLNESERNNSAASSMTSNAKDALDADSMGNDSLAMDPSAIKVCGLQISNQFSIRNRVTASAPLSIAAAPGLILAHGHVATHLKNTPADVFVSSDGGYTWIKALDGPHQYQIANRGGLLVAVPADTLWPDVLRFSTDEGRCWHTIPLRPGALKVDQPGGTSTTVTVNIHSTTENPMPTITPAGVGSNEPTKQPSDKSNSSSSSNYDEWIQGRADETVVFTGLVTEPGGRAMAAAVYGYGTVSQRWRVAVVDFITNGMVNTTCTNTDYEIWTPHSSSEGTQEGCLLGVKQFYKRLRKDSLCINEYGMDPLVHTEQCECTQADYDCEFGYYRQIGSLDCIENPHIPLQELCEVYSLFEKNTQHFGYKKIPGDKCIQNWQPPLITERVRRILEDCHNRSTTSATKTENLLSPAAIAVLILLALISVIFVGSVCYRQVKRSPTFARTRFGGFTLFNDESQSTGFPWHGKDLQSETHQPNSCESLWIPHGRTTRWTGNPVESANGGNNHLMITEQNNAKSKDIRNIFKPGNLPLGRETLTNLSHMRPWPLGRFRLNEQDGKNLLDSEEVAIPTEPTVLHTEGTIFNDPLAELSSSGPATNSPRS